MNYRNDAKKSLERAIEMLSSRNDEDLKYVALELRMTLEALTYDRALAYKTEFPPKEYETWQPKKVMSVLLEIDPKADTDMTVNMGIDENGAPSSVMKSLGSEKILNMSTLKKHYDALGSYLHVPTLKQVYTGKSLNINKVRSRCMVIINFAKDVLSSPIFNVLMGNFAKLECFQCKKLIRKRIPEQKDEVVAECFECQASYTIISKKNGQVEWIPNQHELECANNKCKLKIFVWNYEIERGNAWVCTKCKGRNALTLYICHEPENSFEDSNKK